MGDRFRGGPRAHLSPAELATLASLDARCVTLFPLGGRPQGFEAVRSAPEGLPELEDCTGELTAWLKKAGMHQGAVAVIRPDRFAYALVGTEELPQTVRQLADRWACRRARGPTGGVSSIMPTVRKNRRSSERTVFLI